MEPQRESEREGQVEEGVRVALLKLVTEGSRPMGEMSDSWREQAAQRRDTVSHCDTPELAPRGAARLGQLTGPLPSLFC